MGLLDFLGLGSKKNNSNEESLSTDNVVVSNRSEAEPLSRYESRIYNEKYLTGTQNTEIYIEFEERYSKNELEFHGFLKAEQPMVLTNAENIHGVETFGVDEETFWDHHHNTHEKYLELASHIPDVQERLNNGETIESIREDPNLSECVDAYFNETNMVQVSKYGNTYIHSGEGRHRITAAQELGYDIPVKIVGEYTEQGESVDLSFYNNSYTIKHEQQSYDYFYSH